MDTAVSTVPDGNVPAWPACPGGETALREASLLLSAAALDDGSDFVVLKS